MKIKLFSLFLTLIVLFSVLPTSAADLEEGVGKDEIPYGDNNSAIQIYTYKKFNMMTEDEARSAGVPEGFSGHVLSITKDGGNVGFMMDMTENKTIAATVKSITFRVWCSANTREVRITDNAGKDWIMRVAPSVREEWIDITLEADSANFRDNHTMKDLSDESGFLKPVNFGFRFSDNNETTVYIDSITINKREPDTTAPIISYNGNIELTLPEGGYLPIDVSAHDIYEDRSVEVKRIFSEGAIDENGMLLKGEHTCKLQATDLSGNSSHIILTIHVKDADTENPNIPFSSDTICVAPGTFNMFDLVATDNYEGVTTEISWSDGTFDSQERFAEGTHTLTVIATDICGNQTKKTISVIVAEFATDVDIICDTK